ncbi:hypothetical protein [Laceyella putida]|uniref:XRE family transcriptional regulator n=1 Tax=Laceyella putida TaxID=110101 RepID=A0ABW2RLF5_9BACL
MRRCVDQKEANSPLHRMLGEALRIPADIFIWREEKGGDNG